MEDVVTSDSLVKIYLDTCSLNRLVDELTGSRVVAEQQAMLRIFEAMDARHFAWLSSGVLSWEVSRTPDKIIRQELLRLLSKATSEIAITAEITERASALSAFALDFADALHLAAAESGAADYLITTDDKFIKATNRIEPPLRTQIVNPVDLVQRKLLWLVPKS